MTAHALTPIERRSILARGFRTVALLTIAMSAALFLSAGSFAWPQAWIFLALFLIYFVLWITWGLRYSPDLIMERGQSLRKGGEDWDQVLIRINILLSITTYVVAGLDAGRYHWSSVNPILQVIGFTFLTLGFVLPFLALMNNPFASGIVRIQTERGHKVSTSGPYQIVRHPMYVGSILADLGVPLFLGSYWALIPGFLMAVLFIYRTAREDQTLIEKLPGYRAYTEKVRYRLVPGLW
jgi:protein-S-isoprenylcysteine O-methyltransferase Ste14